MKFEQLGKLRLTLAMGLDLGRRNLPESGPGCVMAPWMQMCL